MKRKRRTKLYVRDKDAIESLTAFGINHRAAIADQCFKRLQQIQSPGDRMSLAIECFVCMMGNIEDLEKAYYALRRKKAGDKGSFFELFTMTGVAEPPANAKYTPKERSARLARKQLAKMGRRRLQAELGLPTFDEWRTLGRTPTALTLAEQRERYDAELDGLKGRMRQAFKNRATKRLMNVYNKCKHGFIALYGGNPPSAILVEKAYGKKKTGCWIQALPFQGTEAAAKQFFENTKQVALTMRCLLTLYGRVEMTPPAAEENP